MKIPNSLLPICTLTLLFPFSARADITYVDALEGPGGNTFATGATLTDTSWIDLTSNAAAPDDNLWMKRSGGDPGWSQHNGGAVIQGQVTGFPNGLPELTTEVTGLGEGRYEVWAFFWEQTTSDTQNWVIDTGLVSGETSSYSSAAGPVPGTDSTSPIDASTLTFSNAPSVTGAGGNHTMYGINLGQVSVADGVPLRVFVDKVFGTGSGNRTIYDGVGYEFAGPLLPPELVSIDELTATFNEPVRAGSSGNITLKRASDDTTVEVLDVTDTTVPGTVTFSGNSVTIDPATELVGGTDYYLLVDPGAIESEVSLAFPGIATIGEWTFTADGTAPVGIDMFPMAGALGIQPNTDLTLNLNFDEEILAVASRSITLHLANGNVVETIDASNALISGSEVTIPVSAALVLDASYYVTVEAGAFSDLSGNPFAGISSPSAWRFSTAVTPITYVDAVEGPAGNTLTTGSTLADTSWVGPDEASDNRNQWNKREIEVTNGGSVFQAWTNPTPVPELTTRIEGLADGTYLIWAFYWDQVQSNSNNWVLSAGLTSGNLTTYSTPNEPAVAGATTAGVTPATDLLFSNLAPVAADSTNLFGIELGTVEVAGGNPVEVFLGNNLATGFANRSWYDGVGYQLVSQNAGQDLAVTSFTQLGAGLWALEFVGRADTTYLVKTSGSLDFDSGSTSVGLTQQAPGDPGFITGTNSDLITTNSEGQAAVQLPLGNDSTNFIRVEIAP